MSEVAPFPPVDGTQPCIEADTDLFFPESEQPEFAAPAVALCRRCLFLRECLAYALTHDIHGIWGGTTTRQRKALRRSYGISATPYTTEVHHAESNRAQIEQMYRGGGLPFVTLPPRWG